MNVPFVAQIDNCQWRAVQAHCVLCVERETRVTDNWEVYYVFFCIDETNKVVEHEVQVRARLIFTTDLQLRSMFLTGPFKCTVKVRVCLGEGEWLPERENEQNRIGSRQTEKDGWVSVSLHKSIC